MPAEPPPLPISERILLIPDIDDAECESVSDAWVDAGGSVGRLERFWEPPPIEPEHVAVYGSDTFCMVLKQRLGLDLIEPPVDLLACLEQRWTSRAVQLLSLDDALAAPFPAFCKSAIPKFFAARVYPDRDALAAECHDLPGDTMALRADVVAFSAEARAFILDGQVLDLAVYEGDVASVDAELLAAGRRFLADLLAAVPIPSPCVLDIGLLRPLGRAPAWALVEANAAWGSGLNGCDPVKVLPAIAAATAVPRQDRRH